MNDTATELELRCYVLQGHTIALRPAPKERDWMDATNERFAYRCLPLNIANQHAWEILCPCDFTASWNGANDLDALTMACDTEPAPAISHFGYGILTLHVPAVFRTPPGYDLFVAGPINNPKHGIQALTGLIETDWSAHNFTMNWKFTAPGTVTFAAGEPFCALFPVPRGLIERFTPVLLPITDDAALDAENAETRRSRGEFLSGQARRDPHVIEQRWQKAYFRGPEDPLTPGHRTKVKLRAFDDRTRREHT